MLFKKIYVCINLFLLLFMGLTAHAFIRTVSGTVTEVSDGDTIQVTTPEQTKHSVRLFGIDAPETPKMNEHTGQVDNPGQPYGVESWKALESKIKGKQINLDIIAIDRYGFMVGLVWLEDRKINLEMVSEGYAEACTEYLIAPYRSEFIEAEQGARAAKKGIWSLPEYERPKDFRLRIKLKEWE